MIGSTDGIHYHERVEDIIFLSRPLNIIFSIIVFKNEALSKARRVEEKHELSDSMTDFLERQSQ